VSSLLPILMLGVAGLLLGGAWSLHKQGTGRGPVAAVGLLGLVAAVAGVFWMLPES
jgi:hypothetical protein